MNNVLNTLFIINWYWYDSRVDTWQIIEYPYIFVKPGYQTDFRKLAYEVWWLFTELHFRMLYFLIRVSETHKVLTILTFLDVFVVFMSRKMPNMEDRRTAAALWSRFPNNVQIFRLWLEISRSASWFWEKSKIWKIRKIRKAEKITRIDSISNFLHLDFFISTSMQKFWPFPFVFLSRHKNWPTKLLHATPSRGFCLTVYMLCFVLRELVIVTRSKYWHF